MSLLFVLILVSYPDGWFGVGPTSASDQGMMLEKGIFSLDYNPAGLAWIDSLEIGAAAEGLFRYNLVGITYKYQEWPAAASVHINPPYEWGFSIGGAHLYRPLALGAAFSASFDTLRDEQTFSLRTGLQWSEYIGLTLGPNLWTAADTAHVSLLTQVGATVPIIDELDFLVGAAAEFGPPTFRIGGGLAYKPFDWVRIQSVVTTENWGAGLLLESTMDRGGIWVRKGFGENEPWQFGLSYVRDIKGQTIKEVIVYRNLPARVDTVYVTQDQPVIVKDTVRVVSPEVREKQEKLMAKANRYYADERYEDALTVWQEVIDLDSTSDLAARAKEDIRDVTALIETLQRIRSGRSDNKPQ